MDTGSLARMITNCYACGAPLRGGATRHKPDCSLRIAMEKILPDCMPPSEEPPSEVIAVRERETMITTGIRASLRMQLQHELMRLRDAASAAEFMLNRVPEDSGPGPEFVAHLSALHDRALIIVGHVSRWTLLEEDEKNSEKAP